MKKDLKSMMSQGEQSQGLGSSEGSDEGRAMELTEHIGGLYSLKSNGLEARSPTEVLASFLRGVA